MLSLSACKGAIALYWTGGLALLRQLWMRSPSPLVQKRDESVCRYVVVTGATSGIGKETAFQLAAAGYRVIVGCQHLSAGQRVVSEICSQHGSGSAVAAPIELATSTGVDEFLGWAQVHGVESLHAVVCNAAVMLVPYTCHDGYEEHFCVNALGHFRFIRRILPLLCHGRGGRIELADYCRVVVVSSVVQHCGTLESQWLRRSEDSPGSVSKHKSLEEHYSSHAAYARSKLALQVLTQALSRELAVAKLPVSVHSVDPGIVFTPLYRHLHWALRPVMKILGPLLLRSADEAAAGVVWAVVTPTLIGRTGTYHEQGVDIDVAPAARDVAVQVRNV